MSIFNSLPPKINQKHLISWLKENYSFLSDKSISLRSFNSERDKNFLINIQYKKKLVLKISNPEESKNILELQDYVLSKLGKRISLKKYIPKKVHSSIKTYSDLLNRKCCVRVLTYIEGEMYASVKHTVSLENSLGSLLGNLSRELQNIIQPSAFREFEWNPSKISWINKEIKMFKGRKKEIILTNLQQSNIFVFKNINKLRFSLTHGDANNYNLVVSKNKISGLLDYGDMIYAPTINDLAISLSYALMRKDDLYSTLKNIITSYHEKFHITFEETFSLITLVKARLTITVVMAEKQRKKFPENKYLSISEKDAWKLLYRLDLINPYLFIFLIRGVCKYPILKNYETVCNFLKTNTFNSILDIDINKINKSIISFANNSLLTKNYVHKPIQLTKKINTYLKDSDSEIGIGLYKEKRNVYRGGNYISQFNIKNKRDIHLGIDIFAKAGTKIRAPLAGKVFILKDNAFEYDYGPTVILEHKINNLNKFYTIYGHLSKKCFKILKIGKTVKKGEIIAEIGKYPANGNWPPHLHFQIALDMMGEKENFPGVSESILFDTWSKISPDPNLILGIPNSFFINNEKAKNILLKRNSLVSKSFSISYKKPLHMLEAKNQYFYDEKGREYLDCVNNISHVGHSHSKIHEAMVKQNMQLNTNTRYLYKIMNDYSKKLLDKFPKNLDTVFFVCTGSEANDLAYRIAQNYTDSKDVLVMDNAYHGHTNTLIDLSPYKFKGRGGSGKKDFVHIADMPDGLRGKWRYSDKHWVEKYILQIKKTVDDLIKNNKKLSCFFVESIMGCGGQVVFPPKYLKEAFKIIRHEKALCIVDEVQTGFGRVGNHFWGFQEHGIIPDIVTLGKPMGNGHPIAAVVTSKKIARKFNNGMEYFNSFGGNPVSCSIGNAVLDVIENEKLQNHSKITGEYFIRSLNKIKQKFPKLISEVRGRGLFLGIDLIKNKNHIPNENLANLVINKMREKGILLSTDGPYHNVIKIKPPMTFSKKNVDLVCFELDNILKNI